MLGKLYFDDNSLRFVVKDESGQVEELHCGDTLSIYLKDGWKDSRIEMDGENEIYGWYFVGIGRAADHINGLVEVD